MRQAPGRRVDARCAAAGWAAQWRSIATLPAPTWLPPLPQAAAVNAAQERLAAEAKDLLLLAGEGADSLKWNKKEAYHTDVVCVVHAVVLPACALPTAGLAESLDAIPAALQGASTRRSWSSIPTR